MANPSGTGESKLRRFFKMRQAQLGLLLVAIGFPICWYFSNVTLTNPLLDQWLPIAGCIISLIGASRISKCIIALQMESVK